MATLQAMASSHLHTGGKKAKAVASELLSGYPSLIVNGRSHTQEENDQTSTMTSKPYLLAPKCLISSRSESGLIERSRAEVDKINVSEVQSRT